jgi:multimeric flavodoxin WrbA
MKILGISGSCRSNEKSGTYWLVKEVLEASGCEYELVSLRGKTIGGCIACLGCAKDNVCVLKDDMAGLRESIVEADAYVIGSPNYFSGVNAVTHALLERLYQFRHRENRTLWGKLAVAVGVGGGSGDVVVDRIETFMGYSFIETVAKVAGQGAASCFECGFGETCKVGAVVMMFGEGVKITDDIIPDVSKQADVVEKAREAGKVLGERLANHDREEVAATMMALMQEKFKSST